MNRPEGHCLHLPLVGLLFIYSFNTLQLADLNDEVEADESDMMSQLQWTDESSGENEESKPAYVIGDDVSVYIPMVWVGGSVIDELI